jgi:prepilin-type processing-associated H-X9-DG protein
MYVDDNNHCYPALSGPDDRNQDESYWYHQLAVYLPFAGTNFTCPSFEGVILPWKPVPIRNDSFPWLARHMGPGYGYNACGIDGPARHSVLQQAAAIRGLGSISESRIKVPAEMFAVTDSFHNQRYYFYPKNSASAETFPIFNRVKVDMGLRGSAQIPQPPQHGKSFNMLFCDGHVTAINTQDLFDVQKSAANWNNDHEPHPETW